MDACLYKLEFLLANLTTTSTPSKMRSFLFTLVAVLATSAASATVRSRSTGSDCVNEEIIHNEKLDNGVIVKGVVCHDDDEIRGGDGLVKREISNVCPDCTSFVYCFFS